MVIDRLLNAARRLSRLLVWIGGALLLLAAFLVTAEVLLRKFFGVSIGGADELSGYAFGVATTLGFAYALFERAHIRVDALYALLPMGAKLAASVIGLVLLLGFAGIASWTALDLVADTLRHGSRSITPMRTPLAIPQIPWLLGWLFFLVAGLLLLIAAIRRLALGDKAGADRLIGVKSVSEQIEDECS
ncbi:MAG: TRAP transporter small permease [Alphaproteobacteria bacterium]